MMRVTHTTAEGRVCTVEVYESTLAHKLARSKHIQQIVRDRKARQEEGPLDILSGLLEIHTFPSCVACSRELCDTDNANIDAENLSFEGFCNLPEQFIEKWAAAVFDVNPGWRDDGGFPQMRPAREISS